MTTGSETALASTANLEFDVVISFAGEQRAEAEAVASHLKNAGAKVFYDKYEQADLWGKDLYAHLAEVYERKARFCLMLVSSAYANKVWTNHERRSAQARAISQNSEYILPVRFDETEIPGLPNTIGHLRFQDHGAEGVCHILIQKLGLPGSAPRPELSVIPTVAPDLNKFWEQRKKLADTVHCQKDLVQSALAHFDLPVGVP